MDNEPAPPMGFQQDPKLKVGNTLTVTQPGERTVCSIKRHPIGIIGVYIGLAVMLIIAAVLAFAVAPHIHDSNGSGSIATTIGALVFVALAVLGLIYTMIASKVYWDNSWIVTTDSVTQVERDSLFNRQSSQLSLGNIEDVTAEQKGILPHMFNYGWLRVETASERGKFVFQFCPNPNYYARQVLAAREDFEQHHRMETVSTQPAPAMQAGDPGYGAFMPGQPATPVTTNVPPAPAPDDSQNDNNSFIVPGV